MMDRRADLHDIHYILQVMFLQLCEQFKTIRKSTLNYMFYLYSQLKDLFELLYHSIIENIFYTTIIFLHKQTQVSNIPIMN